MSLSRAKLPRGCSRWRLAEQPRCADGDPDADARVGADAGSTLPLILGFFLVALMVVAGSVAAGDAYVQQRGLQDVCDGAAAAAAATAIDIERGQDPGSADALRFGDVAGAVRTYLAREPSRSAVEVAARLTADRQTLTLTCAETTQIAFGAVFGKGDGVRHTATSSARAPVTAG